MHLVSIHLKSCLVSEVIFIDLTLDAGSRVRENLSAHSLAASWTFPTCQSGQTARIETMVLTLLETLPEQL